ncbi:MAG: tail fiber domain-containing protein [Blastocatellia bacterium]
MALQMHLSLNAKTTPYAGVYGKNENTTGSAVGVWGDAVGSGAWVYGHSPNGSGIYGSSDTGNGTIGYTFGTSLDNAGVYARSFGTSPAGYFINTDGGLAGRFSGNVRVEGVVTQTSDARLKERITGLRYGLREVMQLRPVSFWWKKQPDSPQQLGLIAQEVETVLPDLVAHSDDATTPLAVNYIGLIPVVIKAVQEQESVVQKQQSELEQKNAEIKAIKAENAALNARLAALEQMMQQLRKQPQQQQQ